MYNKVSNNDNNSSNKLKMLDVKYNILKYMTPKDCILFTVPPLNSYTEISSWAEWVKGL